MSILVIKAFSGFAKKVDVLGEMGEGVAMVGVIGRRETIPLITLPGI